MGNLKICFIRHGTTGMNQLGLFCGRTDALLAREGWEELIQLKKTYDYPAVERVYSSPALRCRETASVFYPELEPVIKEGLWEFDFGQGEKTPAASYKGTDLFAAWLRQDPDCMFPGGETLLEARFRIRAAMTRIIMECREDGIGSIAVVAHGSILASLMKVCLTPEEYADSFLLCPNGMGLVGLVDTETWFSRQEIVFEEYLPKGAPRLKPEDSPYFSDN